MAWRLPLAVSMALSLWISGCGSSDSDASGGKCKLNDWTFSGSVDGQDISGTIAGRGAQNGASVGPWEQKIFFVHGLLRAWGDAPAADKEMVTGKGLLSAPPSSFLAGAQLFSDSTSLQYGFPFSTVHLEGLHRVGTCPGTPVSGSLSGCFGFGLQSSCANPNTLSGTLDGTSISLSSNGAGTVTTDQPPPGYTHYFVDFDDGSTLQLQSDPALDGVLLLSDQSSDPGAVYCMDSVTVSTQGNDKTITVDKVSRAGAMPGNAVTGSIDMTFCLTP